LPAHDWLPKQETTCSVGVEPLNQIAINAGILQKEGKQTKQSVILDQQTSFAI
jgi:hypothetical protein